ncbi:hypothetical protein CYMTET_34745 [Cymbomonas tetramitiformis]|uniref:Uncharacterized protein n=1 Tax=Cymbomonas tetramitiformis TaxID=36881 RepID=A0AAE0FAI2_9CHLO|nr:hypothetical protein CYMTET_34745 [Cymbomonas tetramitiformis]
MERLVSVTDAINLSDLAQGRADWYNVYPAVRSAIEVLASHILEQKVQLDKQQTQIQALEEKNQKMESEQRGERFVRESSTFSPAQLAGAMTPASQFVFSPETPAAANSGTLIRSLERKVDRLAEELQDVRQDVVRADGAARVSEGSAKAAQSTAERAMRQVEVAERAVESMRGSRMEESSRKAEDAASTLLIKARAMEQAMTDSKKEIDGRIGAIEKTVRVAADYSDQYRRQMMQLQTRLGAVEESKNQEDGHLSQFHQCLDSIQQQLQQSEQARSAVDSKLRDADLRMDQRLSHQAGECMQAVMSMEGRMVGELEKMVERSVPRNSVTKLLLDKADVTRMDELEAKVGQGALATQSAAQMAQSTAAELKELKEIVEMAAERDMQFVEQAVKGLEGSTGTLREQLAAMELRVSQMPLVEQRLARLEEDMESHVDQMDGEIDRAAKQCEGVMEKAVQRCEEAVARAVERAASQNTDTMTQATDHFRAIKNDIQQTIHAMEARITKCEGAADRVSEEMLTTKQDAAEKLRTVRSELLQMLRALDARMAQCEGTSERRMEKITTQSKDLIDSLENARSSMQHEMKAGAPARRPCRWRSGLPACLREWPLVVKDWMGEHRDGRHGGGEGLAETGAGWPGTQVMKDWMGEHRDGMVCTEVVKDWLCQGQGVAWHAGGEGTGWESTGMVVKDWMGEHRDGMHGGSGEQFRDWDGEVRLLSEELASMGMRLHRCENGTRALLDDLHRNTMQLVEERSSACETQVAELTAQVALTQGKQLEAAAAELRLSHEQREADRVEVARQVDRCSKLVEEVNDSVTNGVAARELTRRVEEAQEVKLQRVREEAGRLVDKSHTELSAALRLLESKTETNSTQLQHQLIEVEARGLKYPSSRPAALKEGQRAVEAVQAEREERMADVRAAAEKVDTVQRALDWVAEVDGSRGDEARRAHGQIEQLRAELHSELQRHWLSVEDSAADMKKDYEQSMEQNMLVVEELRDTWTSTQEGVLQESLDNLQGVVQKWKGDAELLREQIKGVTEARLKDVSQQMHKVEGEIQRGAEAQRASISELQHQMEVQGLAWEKRRQEEARGSGSAFERQLSELQRDVTQMHEAQSQRLSQEMTQVQNTMGGVVNSLEQVMRGLTEDGSRLAHDLDRTSACLAEMQTSMDKSRSEVNGRLMAVETLAFEVGTEVETMGGHVAELKAELKEGAQRAQEGAGALGQRAEGLEARCAALEGGATELQEAHAEARAQNLRQMADMEAAAGEAGRTAEEAHKAAQAVLKADQVAAEKVAQALRQDVEVLQHQLLEVLQGKTGVARSMEEEEHQKYHAVMERVDKLEEKLNSRKSELKEQVSRWEGHRKELQAASMRAERACEEEGRELKRNMALLGDELAQVKGEAEEQKAMLLAESSDLVERLHVTETTMEEYQIQIKQTNRHLKALEDQRVAWISQMKALRAQQEEDMTESQEQLPSPLPSGKDMEQQQWRPRDERAGPLQERFDVQNRPSGDSLSTAQGDRQQGQLQPWSRDERAGPRRDRIDGHDRPSTDVLISGPGTHQQQRWQAIGRASPLQ